MIKEHEATLKAAGRVLAGLLAGAVCGFALLSLSFVALNLSPSPQAAMTLVSLAAAAGVAVVGVRLWRARGVGADDAPAQAGAPQPAELEDPVAAAEPIDEQAPRRFAVVSRAVRIKRGGVPPVAGPDGQQPQLGVGAALDAA